LILGGQYVSVAVLAVCASFTVLSFYDFLLVLEVFNLVTRQRFYVSESTMKYLVCFLILVIGAITITECAPSPMKQYEDFVKFLQFIGMICRNKKIGNCTLYLLLLGIVINMKCCWTGTNVLLFSDEKRLGEILEDPIFYKKYVPEKSDMSISQIQMLICPKDR